MFENYKQIGQIFSGVEPVSLQGGAIEILVYTFRAESEEVLEIRKLTALNILSEYAEIWNSIKAKIVDRWPLRELENRIFLYVPAIVGGREYEYMLGYEYEKQESKCCAFFAYNNGEMVWSHIDDC